MAKGSIKDRDSSLDIIRIVAFLCVISVHFFLNNQFYKEPVIGKRMYVMMLMRTFFMVCVPLFLMLSGYLMRRKKISKAYYLGIFKTINIYILVSLCALYVKSRTEEVSVMQGIRGILDFSAARYSWYIEMYIGLFLLIPFLNLIYNNLESKKQKQLLILTMLVLTAFPAIINMNYKLMPAWWTGVYPITYYFIGAYLSEYLPKIKNRYLILILLAQVFIFGTFNYAKSYGDKFISGPWQSWGSIANIITTVLMFLILKNINTKNWNIQIKKGIRYIASLCLGGYLVSSIFDSKFYPILIEKVPNMVYRLEYYLPMVGTVVVCSLLLSAVLNLINGFLMKGFSKIFSHKKEVSTLS